MDKKIGVILLAGFLVLPLPAFAESSASDKESSSPKTEQVKSKEKEMSAEQKYQKNIITFDYALNKAVSNSRDLEKQRMELSLLDSKNQERNNQLLGAAASGALSNPSASAEVSGGIVKSLLTAEEQKNIRLRSAKYTEESLRLNMVNIFNRIDTQQKALVLLDKQIDLKTKLNDIAKKQLSIGVLSAYDSKVSQSELDALLQRKVEAQTALKNAFVDLNKYIKVADIIKYNIEPLVYELKPLESSPETVKAHSYNAADFDIRVFSKASSVNMQQILLDNGITALPNGVAQATLNVEKSDVEVLKNEVRNNVTNLFSRLNLMAQGIVTQKLNLTAEEKKLANLEAKLKVGNVRSIDIESQKLVLLQGQNQLQEAIKQYETLKTIYLNPNLAGTMGGSGGEVAAATPAQ